jgi:opacity protein-like surface antigen
MKRMQRLIAAAALATLPTAHGAEGYAGIAAGVWMPDAGGAVRSVLDDGLAGELRAGWRFEQGWAFEGAVGGFQADRTLPAADVTETTLHSMSGWYVLLSGKARFWLPGERWGLGAGTGYGYYSADVHLKDPPATERRTDGNDSGFHLDASVHFRATERASLALEYRQVISSPGDIDLDGTSVLLAAEYRY